MCDGGGVEEFVCFECGCCVGCWCDVGDVRW